MKQILSLNITGMMFREFPGIRRVWSRLFSFKSRGQSGFTLIEVLVVLALGGFVAVGASSTVFQMSTVSDLSMSRMGAVKQLENTLYLINRDSQMAQSIQASGPAGFPLTINWVTWDMVSHSVTYSLSGSEVTRSEIIDGGTPVVTTVARDVVADAVSTNCQYADGVLRVRMSVSVTSGPQTSTEVRSATISPRPVA
jgi:prepilin-type N-terminal cleavage/methylation domain-containing protein